MRDTLINSRWTLSLPEFRAVRAEWQTGWEVARLAAMFELIHPGDIILDIGSEQGDLSALYATWVGEAGGVVLFEPNPRAWPCIRATFEANKVTPHGWFVGFASDTTDLEPLLRDVDDEPRDGWPACAYGDLIPDTGFRSLAESRVSTPQLRIDDYARQHGIHPDVITIDVEGSELYVLEGAEWVLRHSDPIVFVSVHPHFMRDSYGLSDRALFRYMRGLGYEATYLGSDHEMHWMWRQP